MAATAETVRLKAPGGPARLVLRAVEGDANSLKALATAVTARPGHIVVLASIAKPSLVVISRSSDLEAVDARALLSALTAACGGRGGGKAELAQGGGLDATAETILAAARVRLESE
jgi:alanyl-tRNA synthetase